MPELLVGHQGSARFRNRVRRIDGLFEDDLGMAWFSERWPATGVSDKLAPDNSEE